MGCSMCVCLNVYVCSTCFNWAIFTSCSSGISRDKYFSLKWKIDCHPINANYFHWQKNTSIRTILEYFVPPIRAFQQIKPDFLCLYFFSRFFFININENLYECPWKKSFANQFRFDIKRFFKGIFFLSKLKNGSVDLWSTLFPTFWLWLTK